MRRSEFTDGPIAVVGLGLIGGALVRGLRAADRHREIIAVDPDASTRAAVRRAGLAVRVLPEINDTLGAARTIVVASPLAALEPILDRLAQHMDPAALLSDAIGVKLPVALLVARRLPRIAYVGAHPMAGGARGGFANSRADVFHGSPVIISPSPNARPTHIRAIRGLWQALGARPIELSAKDHDRGVALTSHLPYLLGLSLVRLAAERPDAFRLAGPSFHDVIKRVSFEPQIMAAVVASNPFIPKMLREMAGEIRGLADLIEKNPADLLALAQTTRGHVQHDGADKKASSRRSGGTKPQKPRRY